MSKHYDMMELLDLLPHLPLDKVEHLYHYLIDSFGKWENVLLADIDDALMHLYDIRIDW